MSSRRMNLATLRPVIEYRSRVGRYFVCYPDDGVELIMSFHDNITAEELARNIYYGTPFFSMIPVVKYGMVYPRPNITYPKVDELRLISITVVD